MKNSDSKFILLITIIVLAAFFNIVSAQTLPQVSQLKGSLGTAPASGATGTLTTTVTRQSTATTTPNCSSVTPPSQFNASSVDTIRYNVHYLKNPSIFPICVPVKLTVIDAAADTRLHLVAFQSPFNPADITNSARFLGDSGFSVFTNVDDSYFNLLVPGNSSVALVVYNSAGNFPIGTIYKIEFNVKRVFYGGSPVPIPDNNTAVANALLSVNGVGKISNVNVLFPEGPGVCDSTVGNTNAAIDHSWMGDLIVKLRSPQNTIITLIDRIGVPATGNGIGGNNLCKSTFYSSFNPLSQDIENFMGQPVRGNFFSDAGSFRNENANGNWTLNVSDNFLNDTGSIRRFGLELTSIPRARTPFDYDGDNRTDLSIFRPGPGEWWYQKSSNGGNAALQFGQSTDKLTPGDFTGDGITDIAFWRPSSGAWFILRSEDSTFFSFPFGANGDIPVPADYDGDTFTDAAVFRPTDNRWYILRSTDGGVTNIAFGATGDRPVPAIMTVTGRQILLSTVPHRGNGGEEVV